MIERRQDGALSLFVIPHYLASTCEGNQGDNDGM
jgi:hypothetical protein